MEKALYLFCLARPDLLPEKLSGGGIDPGSPLQEVRHEGIAAVYCEVSLDDFTGPSSEAHLKDLAWLTPRVLRHEQVIELVSRSSPVFPARFGTIFSSLDALNQLMAKQHDLVLTFLDRAKGMEEWGLKAYLHPAQAREKLVDSELSAKTHELSASPGLRYMQERRIRAEADAHLRRWLGETATRLRQELAPYAIDTTERRLFSAASPETDGEMVMNLAFLLPASAASSMQQAGARLGHELEDWGLSLQWSGPFPPYSFTPGLSAPSP